MVEQNMPVLFIGHGSPMNAIENNEFSLNWQKIAKEIPKPAVIISISAHWLKEGSAVTAMDRPKTIHDFYGFPEELYRVDYPAMGSPEYANLIKRLVNTVPINLDRDWGFDHGTWSVLKQMYPKADVPVLQLSLDYQISLEKMFSIGKELGQLRKKGALILGSGNLVHNLMIMNPNSEPYPWAVEFDNFVKRSLEHRDYEALLNYQNNKLAMMAHPTNDHYLPLIYIIGAAIDEEPRFFNEKIVLGSVGMRCVTFGLK